MVTYEKHKTFIFIIGALLLMVTVRGIIWFKQHNKPILTLSQDGIFVRNMKEPLKLTAINSIDLATYTHLIVKTWIFTFHLNDDVEPMQLKGINPNSTYDKSSHTYRFETNNLKGYTQSQVAELINQYQQIVMARETLK